MFLGHFEAKLDVKKGRTVLPSSLRKQMGKKCIITKGFERSLMLVNINSWENLIKNITGKSFLSGMSRQTDRFLLGNAFELNLDDQSRFVIPIKLREYANLNNSIIFVGVGNRIEIWDKKSWEDNNQYLDSNIAEITDKLEDNN